MELPNLCALSLRAAPTSGMWQGEEENEVLPRELRVRTFELSLRGLDARGVFRAAKSYCATRHLEECEDEEVWEIVRRRLNIPPRVNDRTGTTTKEHVRHYEMLLAAAIEPAAYDYPPRENTRFLHPPNVRRPTAEEAEWLQANGGGVVTMVATYERDENGAWAYRTIRIEVIDAELLYEGNFPEEHLVRTETPEYVSIYRGAKNFEWRATRMDLSDGSIEHFDEDQRKVRTVHLDGRKEFFEGPRWQERKVREMRADGTIRYFWGPRGQEVEAPY